MKKYSGHIVNGVCEVRVHENENNHILEPDRSQAVYNHSPDGFQWGYGGSGPSQLSLALLLDFTNDVAITNALYMDFKWMFVASFQIDKPWTLDGANIQAWLETKGHK